MRAPTLIRRPFTNRREADMMNLTAVQTFLCLFIKVSPLSHIGGRRTMICYTMPFIVLYPSMKFAVSGLILFN